MIEQEGMNEKIIKITSVANTMEAEMIMEIFRNNNIPSFKKSKGTGGYMNLYMGYSVYGEDIYVGEDNADAAKRLLEELESDEAVEYEVTSENQELTDLDSEENEIVSEGAPYYRKQKVTAMIILAAMIGSVIFVFILNNLW